MFVNCYKFIIMLQLNVYGKEINSLERLFQLNLYTVDRIKCTLELDIN